eukprot:TRINITY_DN5732_c0_g1_i4.p2 TRINITY_DN5732_c0_g1~~TRINITY_DN5732_c0_g1_i4.p2  ORF type:complete len:100 (-),score=9.46 TRINITY_DN5732_c0_g1_i4:19-318(-)
MLQSNRVSSLNFAPFKTNQNLKNRGVVKCQQRGLEGVQQQLISKRSHLNSLVEQEDYEQAAKVRDEINLLEFEMRKLELEITQFCWQITRNKASNWQFK